MNECRLLCSDSWEVTCFIQYMNTEWLWEITCFIQYMNTEWIWEVTCFMSFTLTCGAVFWAADYLRLPGILSYPQQAVCEDRQCSPGHCSGKSHILAWAWQHCQEDLLHIIHIILICSQFTWSDIWLSAYHAHSSEDDSQEAFWCKMIFIYYLYHNLLSWAADDYYMISCRNFLLKKQIQN